MLRQFIVLITIYCIQAIAGQVYAQYDSDEPAHEEPEVGLFELQPFQKNHQVSVQLPNEGVLMIDFMRISDWGDKNELEMITQTARQQIENLLDSFRHNASSKTVSLNIPIDEKTISIAYKEDNNQGSQLAYKDGEYYQLKTTFDTLRVIRNKGVRTEPKVDSGLIQIAYTFSVKNLEDISALAENKELLQKIGDSLDVQMAALRSRWHRPDSRTHQAVMSYDATKDEAVKVSRDGDALFPFMRERIALYLGVGGILFNNQLAPVLDLTLAYVVPTHKPRKFFVGLNMYSFATFNPDLTPIRQYSSYNVEFGVFRSNRGLMRSKVSIAYGVMFGNVKGDKVMFNTIINWGVSPYMTIGLNAASTLKFNKSDRGIIAVHLKFNL